MEAAVPAKPQNTFERRAGEPASTHGSAGTGGHSQRGNNHWCETELCPGMQHVTVQELCYNKTALFVLRTTYGLVIAFKSTPDLAEFS